MLAQRNTHLLQSSTATGLRGGDRFQSTFLPSSFLNSAVKELFNINPYFVKIIVKIKLAPIFIHGVQRRPESLRDTQVAISNQPTDIRHAPRYESNVAAALLPVKANSHYSDTTRIRDKTTLQQNSTNDKTSTRQKPTVEDSRDVDVAMNKRYLTGMRC